MPFVKKKKCADIFYQAKPSAQLNEDNGYTVV